MEKQRSTTPGEIPNSCRKPRSQRHAYPSFKDGYTLKDYKDKAYSFNIYRGQSEKNSVQVKSIKRNKNGFFHNPMETKTPSIKDRIDANLHTGPSTLSKSVLVQCKNDSWLLPGNIVWAQTDNNQWWPAEIIDATSLLKGTGIYSIGRNLVKYFGNNSLAWLDPRTEISEFNPFYEERCKNSSIIFQDALDQALNKHLNSSAEISPLKFTSSQETKGSQNESVSRQRKRKMKLHFDDLTVSEKTTKRIRRIKIMRHLGLMAPAGSPFCLPRVTS